MKGEPDPSGEGVPDETSEPVEDEVDWEAYLAEHAPSPELQARFDQVDVFLAGLTKPEALAAVASMYFDGDGELRRRDQVLRLVRSDEVAKPGAVPESMDDGVQPVRDVDTLTPEDRERGDRIMQGVQADLDRRRADRADGVVDLAREKLMRRRRRRGLPAPD